MLDIRSTVVAVVTGLVVACAGPAAAENVLRFTGKDAWAATMDPHAYADEDNKGATYQVYEALLDIDSNLAVVPQLAVAWQILDPTHWEFELRQGVHFHDGTPFTADDVVFSIGRAQAEDLGFPGPGRQDRGRRSGRRSYHPHHDHGAGPVALAEARRRRDHVEGLGPSARCDETRRFRWGARGDLRLAPRQRHRAVRARIVRAARRLGHGPQSRLVGHGRLSAQQHRPHRSRPESRSRERRRPARRRDRSAPDRAVLGPRPDPQQPGAEARLSAQVAHDILRPRSGQRRAALVQHQGAQPVQGQSGCVRRWPTRST